MTKNTKCYEKSFKKQEVLHIAQEFASCFVQCVLGCG